MAKPKISNKSAGSIQPVPVAPSFSVSTTLGEHTETLSDTVIDTTTQSAQEDDASSSVSVYSDTLTSMEYPEALTPPDTTSHIVMIDPPTLDYSTRLAALHPDASFKEVREYLMAFIVDTLHRLEGQPLEDAEAHAEEYVARFVTDLEQDPHPMDATAATHLYMCSEERLRRIFSQDAEPPRILCRVCFLFWCKLRYSKYGKDYNRFHVLLLLGFAATFSGFVLNIMAVYVNDPTSLASSIVLMTLLHLSLKGLFRYASSKEGLANPYIPEHWKPRPWCVSEEVFEKSFKANIAFIWVVPLLILINKIKVGLGYLLGAILGWLMA
ncbi:MAG: hypothetical protein Q9221_007369 [Calogaya cf. arnoldii]